MRYLSVCSGIEAASVAWKPLGWECVAVAEVGKFPSAVLKHHYPNVPNWGDIERFKEWPEAAFDVLVGGTPCQSFSVAGLRKGLEDLRGNLSLTYCAIAHRYRPSWVLWENVPGVLSEKKNAFGCFLAALSGADAPLRPPVDGWDGAGVVAGPVYGLAWRVLDAQYFGLAQRRKRVFVVGSLGDWRPAALALFEPEGLPGNPPPSQKAGQGVTGTLEARARSGGGLGDIELGGGAVSKSLRGRAGASHRADSDTYIAVAGTLSACLNGGGQGRIDGESETFVVHALKGEGHDASEDGTGRGVPLIPTTMKMREGKAGGGKDPLLSEDKSLTLETSNGQTLFQPIPLQEVNARRGKKQNGSGIGVDVGGEGRDVYAPSRPTARRGPAFEK